MAKKAKKTARKAPARRAAPRKAAAKKSAKISPASKPRTKGEIYNAIASQTELSRKQVVSVFDALSGVLAADLGKRGPGICNIPGLAKVVVQRKPATKARKGINPFTGEETMFKAKPARNVVKVRALKNLKTMV
jgi:nucleoid DNA-binding protein